MQLLLDKIKNKFRRQLYNSILSKFGFGNRVSKSIWNNQFRKGFWDYLYTIEEEGHYAHITSLVKKNLPKGRILDIGCGQGVLYNYLEKEILNLDYMGIDIADEAIKIASNSYPNSNFKQLDYEHETLVNRFDLIIFNETLYYFNQPLKTIKKCIDQNLNANGLIIISMCDFIGHDVIWNRLQKKYHFLSLGEIKNDQQQKWKVGIFKP